MIKQLANIISFSRIVAAFVLIFTETFTIEFFVVYFYCGVTDIIDGIVARKMHIESNLGVKIDGVADMIFVTVSLYKILPSLHISHKIWIWIGFITLVKVSNFLYGYINYNHLITVHSTANKFTGFLLFLTPFVLSFIKIEYLSIFLCFTATLSAIQEGYLVRNNKY
ncbi:CDP-alcohol phosphatidyltransferase family protein [Peptostreptococcus faecalis]|uniref:CDP-alcohol phosphatidyltransferase family protein n=1 Tax=Peptostreptococcus faecalis TaxID=2045015 RepID=UPI000C79B84E|nr:CDP-alcohol phosphatidyltransferase family protein [Peptostreptococcus faecalis]